MKRRAVHFLWRLPLFFLWYGKEILMSNLRVALDVLTPQTMMRPGIIAVPLDPMSDRQLLMLSLLLTMTPGTLALDVSDDRRTLYLHAMFIDNADTLRRELKETYQRKICEVF
jgi:multicomponent Na+:H+ antiporter subunit E